MMIKQTRLAALLSSCMLAACSSTAYQQAQQQYKDNSAKAEQLNKLAAQPLPKADMSILQVHSGVYLGAVALKRQSGQTLPVRVEHDGVRLMSSAPQSLVAIGDLITEASGIPVSFAADVFDRVDTPQATNPSEDQGNSAPGDQKTEALAAALDAALPHTSIAKSKTRQPSVFAGKQTGSSRERMRVNYKGPLSGFLNLTASYFDVGWSYRDGRLQFSRQISRTFQLVAMPSVMDSSSQLNAGMSAAGGGDAPGIQAGSNQTAKVSVKLDFWKDLDTSLKTIIGTKGSFSTSSSGSSVTVTGPASVVERVAKYIQDLNKQLLRQVTVKVEVYTVQLDQQSDWNVNLSGAFSIGGLISGQFGDKPADSDITNPLISGTARKTDALVRALDSQGNVSVVTRTSVTTMSGQPVPVQVSNTRGYISSLTSTVEDGVTTFTAEQSTVNSGFSINVLPKVMDDGKVLLQYSMNISTLAGKDDGFTNYKIAGDSSGVLQLPNVDQRSFIQEGVINNGSTLVLAGYEKANNTTGDTGTGSPNFKVPTGGRKAGSTREVMVICITPVVLDHSVDAVGLN